MKPLRLGLRGRLIAGQVGLVIGFLVLGCGVLSALISHYAELQLSVELTAARRSYESHSRLEREAMRGRAEFLADSGVLKALVGTNDRQTIEDGLPGIARHAVRDLLLVYSPDGRLLGMTGARLEAGAPDPALLPGADGDRNQLLHVGRQWFLAVQVPVYERELQVATLVLGRPLDDVMAEEVAAATSHDAVVWHDDRVQGVARQDAGPEPSLTPAGTAELARLARAGAGTPAGAVVTLRLGASDRRCLCIPLHPAGGTLLLSRDPEQITALRRSAFALLISVAAVVGMIGVLICLRVAQRLSRPLVALTRATELLAGGDHAVRVEEQGHDEIARLGRAFNDMAATIGRLVADVREQAARAEAANRAKDGFLSTASHELRTPATNVRAYAEIMQQYGEGMSATERTGCAGVILAEADRLESLIVKVLEFSELEAGTRVWRCETVDLTQVAQSACETFRAPAARRRIELELVAAGTVTVAGDAAALSRLLANLLENAIHFSPEHGTVSIGLGCQGGTAELRVRDRGPGVPDGVKQKVFERFYQHGDLLTQKPPGLGLGLTFVRTIAEAHGGSCRCEDAPGGGAVFVVVLPGAAAGPAAGQGRGELAGAAATPGR